MKKNELVDEWDFSCLTKTFRIMRITLFLMLALILQTFANEAYSQKTKLSLDYSNTRLEVVLDEIEELSEFFFLANEKLVDLNRSVSLSVENKKINEILDMLFAGTDVVYTITDRKIILAPSFLTEGTQQQQPAVSGTVTDESGLPLPGVTVVIKGTTQGTVTGADGNYTITNVPENATLVFSFVGMLTQEVVVGDQTNINIEMSVDAIGIEEVVAVGYGSQKRANLTGSVASISADELEILTVTQTSQLFTGLVSGVTVMQSSGQPGKDNVNITVRGLGTFSGAGNRPLVLVDGIASSLDNVNINDIANISVLKDAASASIYGTRGANGVILIETKTGRAGEFKISYNSNFGIQSPTEIPDIVDSWVYAEMYNEALTNAGGSPQYSSEEIAKFKSGEDPDNYPNKRHYDDLINSGSGFQMDHHLSFTGGTEKSSYMFSLGFLDQEGLIDETNYKRYNLLLNVKSDIKDNVVLNVKIAGKKGLANEPTAVSAHPPGGVNGLLSYAIKIPNTYAGKMSNGYYGNQVGFTIEGWMDSESFISNYDQDASANVSLDWNLTKSLKLTGVAGYNYGTNKYKRFRPVLVVDENFTEGPSNLTERVSFYSLLTRQLYANYDLSINSHNIHVLAGYSDEQSKNNWLEAYRDNFPNNLLYEINAGAASNQQNEGSASEWAIRSFFGRVNYDFNGKYLFEANARYDGSSRFAEDNRYGLFPSLSAGWRISEEKFFAVPLISNLKIRASWGELGNQNIGNYPYQQVLQLGFNAPFGIAENLASGAAATVVPNKEISWESTRVIDVGVDINLFENKLNFVVDYFDKLTSGILYNVTASNILGLEPSIENAGEVSNKGIDFSVRHQNSLGDFSYNISANFSYVKNAVVELANVERDIASGLFIGYPLQSVYGYVDDGLFVDQADIDNSPSQPRTPKPGDIKFKDISGPDGEPDGIVDADYDRKIIGNRFPKYNYGAQINTRYKNVDLSLQLQGIAGFQQTIGGYEGNAFYTGSSPQQWMVDSRWTTENPDPNAEYPRFQILSGGEQQFWNSTYILKDASFLRISNIQLGYNLPPAVLSNVGVSSLRLYIGVKNLFTFHHFRKGWDPELRSGYPPVKFTNVGINLNF